MIFILFLIVILIIIIWGFSTNWKFINFTKKEEYEKGEKGEKGVRGEKGEKGEKGVAFFDIDGTLIDAIDNIDYIVQKCLDHNYGVGIITASGRTPEHLCQGDKSLVSWAGSKLCKYMKDTNYITYNSATPILAGKRNFPFDYPSHYPANSQGTCKGYAMMHYSKIKNIKPENIVLFDDQSQVVDDVKKFNPKLGAILVDCNAGHCKDGRNASKLSVSVVDNWFKSK